MKLSALNGSAAERRMAIWSSWPHGDGQSPNDDRPFLSVRFWRILIEFEIVCVFLVGNTTIRIL
jgi:hypothetical protein